MRRLAALFVLSLTLLALTEPAPSQAWFNCTDNDGDGVTTCAGDCADYDPYIDNIDHDGDGVTGCQGDCADGNPYINTCDYTYRQEPNYTLLPEICNYTYMRVTRRSCPWGGGPPPQCTGCPDFSNCTILSQDDYLVQDSCR